MGKRDVVPNERRPNKRVDNTNNSLLRSKHIESTIEKSLAEHLCPVFPHSAWPEMHVSQISHDPMNMVPKSQKTAKNMLKCTQTGIFTVLELF